MFLTGVNLIAQTKYKYCRQENIPYKLINTETRSAVHVDCLFIKISISFALQQLSFLGSTKLHSNKTKHHSHYTIDVVLDFGKVKQLQTVPSIYLYKRTVVLRYALSLLVYHPF